MEVEPLRDMNDVKRLYNWFKENRTVKEAECFLIGCNVALRVSDLLSLRFDQFEQGQKTVLVNEKKTGKQRIIPVTPIVLEAVGRLREYYASRDFYKAKKFEPTYLFQSTSRRAFHLCQPFCTQHMGLAFKEAQRDLELDFNINTHSMRKTWGYHAYEGGADILYIQALLNHAHQHVTLLYIGVTKSTIQKMYFDNSLEIAS